MPASIGVNLRVTGHCRQGGRKYMEDFFSVAYQQTEDEKDLEYAFFGIYDGHGGAEAAAFAKEHLMETIIKHKNFWSDYDEDVLRAIKDGYIATHYAMWREQEKWPKTASGLPSTAGTTASVAFIRRGKIYIGHVGDSGIILGYQEPGSNEWKAKPLTRDHKPENAEEMCRIKKCGGKVIAKSGVPRVVWNRPKIGHQGPVRRSTPIDEIPFLAVARSLGDLWSYNSQINQFIVSPDPDCSVLKIDTNIHRCLIFGTDGLYNMLNPSMTVHIVQQAERHNENAALSDSTFKTWMNPSKLLVERALERWHATKMRADNTSVVTLMLDPPGPPRAQVLKDRKKNLPERGLKIMTRFDDSQGQDTSSNSWDTPSEEVTNLEGCNAQTELEEVLETPEPNLLVAPAPEPCVSQAKEYASDTTESAIEPPTSDNLSVSSSDLNMNYPLKERNFVPKLRESTSFDPREPLPRNLLNDNGKENQKSESEEDNTIQCNEVSSSNIELDSSCMEEETSEVENNAARLEKPNLRSSKKEKPIELKPKEEKVKVSLKRKRETDSDSPQLRKSMRLDQHKKTVEAQETQALQSNRKAFVAEEKLKKLAQKADQTKKSIPPQKTSKSNLKEVNRKVLQTVLDKVKSIPKAPRLKTLKPARALKVNVKNEKISKEKVTMLNLKRSTRQNASQWNKMSERPKRERFIKEVSKKIVAKATDISKTPLKSTRQGIRAEKQIEKFPEKSGRSRRTSRKVEEPVVSSLGKASSTKKDTKIRLKVPPLNKKIHLRIPKKTAVVKIKIQRKVK